MLKRIAILLLAGIILFPITAQAQGISSLDKLEVDLWPEYDRPQMLVIYRIQLASGTHLPASVSIRIPASAGDPTAVAVRSADGNLYSINYNRQVSGAWAAISFSTSTDEAQLEYYDPNLIKNGVTRSFTFTWPGDYEVKSFTVQVQQPLGASNMQINPSLGAGLLGSGGLMYFAGDLGPYPAQQQVAIHLSYTKPDDTLSVQSGKVEPSSPVNTSTPGRSNIAPAWIFAMGAAAIALIGGGGWLYWRSSRDLPGSPRRRNIPYREKPTQPILSDQIYCHQCGKRASPGDLFCRSCGTRLRRD